MHPFIHSSPPSTIIYPDNLREQQLSRVSSNTRVQTYQAEDLTVKKLSNTTPTITNPDEIGQPLSHKAGNETRNRTGLPANVRANLAKNYRQTPRLSLTKPNAPSHEKCHREQFNFSPTNNTLGKSATPSVLSITGRQSVSPSKSATNDVVGAILKAQENALGNGMMPSSFKPITHRGLTKDKVVTPPLIIDTRPSTGFQVAATPQVPIMLSRYLNDVNAMKVGGRPASSTDLLTRPSSAFTLSTRQGPSSTSTEMPLNLSSSETWKDVDFSSTLKLHVISQCPQKDLRAQPMSPQKSLNSLQNQAHVYRAVQNQEGASSRTLMQPDLSSPQRLTEAMRKLQMSPQQQVLLDDGSNHSGLLHYPVPQLPQNMEAAFTRNDVQRTDQQTSQYCPPPHKQKIHYGGLSNAPIENGHGERLLQTLEGNYMKYRNLVFNRYEGLVTPLKFLTLLCQRANIPLHKELFSFTAPKNSSQWRTELYVGMFCGVAHATRRGLSTQLAAAHVLERIFIPLNLNGWSRPMYALFPGSTYMGICGQLENLCKKFNMGDVKYEITNRKTFHKKTTCQESEPQFKIICMVNNQVTCVYSDDEFYGKLQAARNMYEILVGEGPSGTNPLEKIRDYFAVGAECPVLNNIHASVALCSSSSNKEMWKKVHQVKDTDSWLHDPTNESKYINLLKASDKDFACRSLLEAIEWIENKRKINWNENNKRNSHKSSCHSSAIDGNQMDVDEVEDRECKSDKDDEESFYDAMEEPFSGCITNSDL